MYRLTTRKLSNGKYASNVWKNGRLIRQEVFKNRMLSKEYNINFRKWKRLD